MFINKLNIFYKKDCIYLKMANAILPWCTPVVENDSTSKQELPTLDESTILDLTENIQCKHDYVVKCCQDRAGDEMINTYRVCKNCGYVTKSK